VVHSIIFPKQSLSEATRSGSEVSVLTGPRNLTIVRNIGQGVVMVVNQDQRTSRQMKQWLLQTTGPRELASPPVSELHGGRHIANKFASQTGRRLMTHVRRKPNRPANQIESLFVRVLAISTGSLSISG
jgi:hypothetical protein